MKLSQWAKINFIILSCATSTCYAVDDFQPNSYEDQNQRQAITRNLSPEEDARITKAIETQIKKSKILKKFDIDIKTQNGNVALAGQVDSDTHAGTLVEIAQSIIGTKSVNTDGLKVKKSQQPLTDTYITAKVKGLFIREKVFGTRDIAAINISVETKDGVVYLSGQIDNQEQVKNAIELASHIKGVKKVEYNLYKITPLPPSNR